ncbi:hypothetical protein [Aestuariibacter salexigens]|uniref:hypothetical protein n=1 Tax=Aestuariibacter salexigens TaxID=226010 RepID=UPI0003F87186|nr:hypothetical protein [Aestuariibacter salexigens]
MGLFFEQDSFDDAQRQMFAARLHEQLAHLQTELTRPCYSKGQASIGAELEVYLTDAQFTPASVNQTLIKAMQHPQLTEELNRFNLEFNLSPVAAAGSPFSAMRNELNTLLTQLQNKARDIDTQVIPIGILPTLEEQHLSPQYMTDLPRYRALTRELTALRGEAFQIDIHGQDTLRTECSDVTLEGANTSFQLHLKVPANRFSAMFNAAQLATPLVLALSGNSPLLLGKRLWQETRIALFKQSIDSRLKDTTQWRQPARVSFGHGWVREGAWELFAQNVALYPPILPYLFDNTPFGELCLHHGTVWPWNRAVLQAGIDGHVRIEYRALPAGPTVADSMANAALLIGLTVSLASNIEEYLVRLPFEYAEYNFYRTAQCGLNANILWPSQTQHHPQEVPVAQVIKDHLQMAKDGLLELSVDVKEIDHYLDIIERRLAFGQTGASWQLETLQEYNSKMNRTQALAAMLRDYVDNMTEGEPVACWK